MSTLAGTATEAVPARATERARGRDLFAAEWIKLWSLRSTAIVFGAVTLFCLYITWRGAMSTADGWTALTAKEKAGYDPGHDAFGGLDWFLLMIAMGTLGAMSIAGEYASGLIRTTFAAVPARRGVVLSKAAVMAVASTLVGFVISAGGFAITAAEMSGHDPAIGFGYPDVWRAIAASTLLSPVCALTGMGLAAILRNTAATIFTTAVVYLLLPLAFKAPNNRWLADIGNAMPFYAWGRLSLLGSGHVVANYDPTVTGSWIALAAWPVVSIIVCMVLMQRRDV